MNRHRLHDKLTMKGGGGNAEEGGGGGGPWPAGARRRSRGGASEAKKDEEERGWRPRRVFVVFRATAISKITGSNVIA